MKKVKLLVLSLATSVMLMGAGYAAWTDTTTINNSVSTGYVNVTLGAGTLTLPQYVTGTAVVKASDTTNHTATVTLNNLYPGATAHVVIPFTNASTIPVKVTGATAGTITNGTIGKNLASYITVSPITFTSGTIAENGGPGTIAFDVTVNSDAPNDSTENAIATFDVITNFAQWQ